MKKRQKRHAAPSGQAAGGPAAARNGAKPAPGTALAWFKRQAARPGFFPAACYALCVGGWLLLSLISLGRDAAARANGSLAPFALDPAALEPVNAVWEAAEENGAAVLLTLTDDPQLLWRNPDGRAVRTLRFAAVYENSPREMCLYYTSAPGEPFSQDKRVFAVPSDDGESYLYTLPQGRIAALRLDPCSTEENRVTVFGIALNEPMGLLSYLSPGWYGAFRMALWPGLAAAVLELLRQLWRMLCGRQTRAKPPRRP